MEFTKSHPDREVSVGTIDGLPDIDELLKGLGGVVPNLDGLLASFRDLIDSTSLDLVPPGDFQFEGLGGLVPNLDGLLAPFRDLIDSTSPVFVPRGDFHHEIQAVAHAAADFFSSLPPGAPLALAAAVVLDAVVFGGALKKTLGGRTNPGDANVAAASAGNMANPYSTNGRYNAKDAVKYFSARPLTVAKRALTIASLSSGFGVSLLLDLLQGEMEPRSRERASQLVGVLTRLGPTFIKIGQSLSIRSDLLSPAYLEGLAELQDRVPAFSSDEAYAILSAELGRPVSAVFEELSPDPVAAASLGQVYRGKLRAGVAGPSKVEVAVKVQRPGITESVALDMYLIRSFGPVLKAVFNLQTDVVGTVDLWGAGFVDELDYSLEATNGQRFTESIAKTPLGGTVFAPPVVPDLSTRRVLTTEWVVGERLELSSAADIERLCSICMNTYLTMLLETGMLHADPHPGNLLRTPDGRLCILDWGLVTEIRPDIQMCFIEHVAHLTSRDYAKVPADLVALGFVPPGREEAIQATDAVEVLSEVYSQFAGGGGAAKIDVGSVVGQLKALSDKYGNLFQLPPYFAYIARAFGVLEGIGLTNNPDYGACLCESSIHGAPVSNCTPL